MSPSVVGVKEWDQWFTTSRFPLLYPLRRWVQRDDSSQPRPYDGLSSLSTSVSVYLRLTSFCLFPPSKSPYAGAPTPSTSSSLPFELRNVSRNCCWSKLVIYSGLCFGQSLPLYFGSLELGFLKDLSRDLFRISIPYTVRLVRSISSWLKILTVVSSAV